MYLAYLGLLFGLITVRPQGFYFWSNCLDDLLSLLGLLAWATYLGLVCLLLQQIGDATNKQLKTYSTVFEVRLFAGNNHGVMG